MSLAEPGVSGMRLTKILPSMFHRRLLLLLGACMAAFGGLAAQLVHLTAAEGDGLLRTAEAKLVRQRWTPTSRGKILDRKDRVLAQDRPSFAAKVKYDVIAGSGGSSTWARLAAAAAARRRNTPAWEKLDDAAREELIGRYQAIYDTHVESMWASLAEACAVQPEDLRARRDAVIKDVERQKRYFVAQGVEKEYRKQLKLMWKEPSGGDESPEGAARLAEIEARVESVSRNYLDPDARAARESDGLHVLGPPADNAFLDRVEAKYRHQQIAEEGRLYKNLRSRLSDHGDGADAHSLATSLTDAQGFKLLRLAEEEVELDVSAADLRASAAGRDRVQPTETVELMPGLVVADSGDRAYPFDLYTVTLDRGTFPGPLRTEVPLEVTVNGVACHLIGRLRSEVHKEDPEHRSKRIAEDPDFALRVQAPDRDGGPSTDRGSYQAGDVLGDSGVEGSCEDDLRGLRGLSTLHVDTGKSEGLPPEPGRDVRLTIDAVLEARVQAAMSPEAGLAVVQPWQGSQGNDETVAPMPPGTPLNGAAVVIDCASGEILALVSTPGFTRQQLRDDPGVLFNDEVNYPLINKAISRPYPPGSIAKAMVLCGAVAHGDYAIGERIACTGHLFPNKKDSFRCWVYREHYGFATHSARLGHDPDAAEALMVSCNIFYFTLGRRLGSEGIFDTYMKFGLGDRWNLGVGSEYPGKLGSTNPDPKGAAYLPQAVSLDEATMMGIGQGPVAWTPLHAADAYATLARGGVRIQPHLIIDPSRPPKRTETGFDPRAISVALEGLRRSVNEHDGTGNHLLFDQRSEPIFNAPGVDVWGKTGTAQTSPTVVDPDGPEGPEPKRVVRDGDHSWFVVLVGPKGGSPKYSIAVMMEYAGSGGKVSGPIVNQIIHALVAEGYLPGGERAESRDQKAGGARGS